VDEHTRISTACELVTSDCVPYLRHMGCGIADLIFADPPYNIGYDYPDYDDKQPRESYLRWSRAWIAAVSLAAAEHGSLWIAIGDEYAAEIKTIAQEYQWIPRSWVIWHYTFGVNCAKNFARSHTHLLYFVRDAKSFTFNADEQSIRVPSARQVIYNDKRANPKGKLPDNTWVLHPAELAKTMTPPNDVWLESRICGTHGERVDRGSEGARRGIPQMPLSIMRRIIAACSNSGDLVVDPFSGTASTGVAAMELGRRYLGIEQCEVTQEIAARRLRDVVAIQTQGDGDA